MKKAILLFVIFALCISCKEDNPVNPVKKPHICTIVPAIARINEIISVIGTNFRIKRGTSFVSIDSITVSDYLSWSDTLIKIIIPKGAVSGKLSVTVYNIKSNVVDFTLEDTYFYSEVKIGTQTWMTKNLDVDHYRNGDSIPEVRDSAAKITHILSTNE